MSSVTQVVAPPAGAPARTSPRRVRRGGIGTAVLPWLFLVLPVGLLLLLTYLPAANMVGYSFTNWDGLSKTSRNVGFNNYVRIFTDPELFQVFFVSAYYLVGAFVQMALALFFATLLSFKIRAAGFFKGVIFFPYLINGVAIGMVFLYFFQPGGTLDTVLSGMGLGNLVHQWLGDPQVVNYSLAGASIWRYMGLNFILFLGAIQSIPADLYEAAAIDGATAWQQFWHIIVPGIRRIIGLSFILAISGSLAVFEIPYIMTGGANGSMTFVIQTVNTAFKFHKVGLASAMAVVLLLIVLVVTAIQRKVFPDEKVDLS